MGARACIERQKRLRGGHAAARLQLPPLGRESEPRRNGGHDEASLVQKLVEKISSLGRPDPVGSAGLPDERPAACAEHACEKHRLRSGKVPRREQKLVAGSERLAENLRIVQSLPVGVRAAAHRKHGLGEKARVTAVPEKHGRGARLDHEAGIAGIGQRDEADSLRFGQPRQDAFRLSARINLADLARRRLAGKLRQGSRRGVEKRLDAARLLQEPEDLRHRKHSKQRKLDPTFGLAARFRRHVPSRGESARPLESGRQF